MSEQKQQPIISIDHVSMRFNLAKEKHESLKEYFVALLHGGVRFDEFFALSDVSFDIMPGDFYGLIGLNGSGKSTLLKVISGVYKPSAGKVTVNGTIAPLIELGASETRQRRRFLQVQLAVRLDLLRGGYDLLQDLVKTGVIGVQRQLLGHEAHRGVVDAVDLLNGILHLGGTVGAVDFELVMLLHNSFLLILYL